MTATRLGPIVWTSVQTDHLDTTFNFPLELGLVVTDPRDLSHELASYHATVRCHVQGLQLSEWAKATHAASGLLADLAAARGAKGLEQIDREATAVVQKAWETYSAAAPAGVTILPPTHGGSRPDFQRAVMRRRFPRLHESLHHRQIDVATIREVMRRFLRVTVPPDTKEHRALADARVAIRTMSAFLRVSSGQCRHPKVSGAMDCYVCDDCGAVGTFQELRS